MVLPRKNKLGSEVKKKLDILEDIVDTGLTHRELAQMLGERIGKKVLPGSIHNFLIRDAGLYARYAIARKEHVQELNQLRNIANSYGRAELRLARELNRDFEKFVRRDIECLTDSALRDYNIYLHRYPEGKHSPETIHEIFKKYHAGDYANQIAEHVGLRQKSVTDVLERMNYRTHDGRSHNSLFTPAQKRYIRYAVPKFGYLGTATRLGFDAEYKVRRFAVMNGIKSPFKHKA